MPRTPTGPQAGGAAATESRELNRALHRVLLIAREKRHENVGSKPLNDQIVSELESHTPEVVAFVEARYEFWSGRTATGNKRFLDVASQGNHAAYMVQGELYRAAVAASAEGVPLPDVLVRRLT